MASVLDRIRRLEAAVASRKAQREHDRNFAQKMQALFLAMDRTVVDGVGSTLLPERWYPLRTHAAQTAYYLDERRLLANPSGRRSGKTENTKRKVVKRALAYPQQVQAKKIVLGGPTQAQAMQIWWDDIQALMPKEFVREVRLTPYPTIKLTNNVNIQVVGLDKPSRVEGDPMLGFAGDEIADCKKVAWVQHVRPMLADTGGWAMLIGVPEGRNHWWEICEEAKENPVEWGYHHWFSEIVLPASEIESMRRSMDPRTFKQETQGSFELLAGRVYYGYDPVFNTGPVVYNPNLPLIVTMDFNVEPGTAGYLQEQRNRFKDRPYLGDYITACIGEVWIPHDSNTPTVCRKIIADWHGDLEDPSVEPLIAKHKGEIHVYGDATGAARSTKTEAGSDWAVARAWLHRAFGPQVRFFIKQANPSERTSVNAANSRFCSADGVRHFVLNKKLAPKMHRDLEGVVIKEGTTEIDDSNPELTHLSDGLRYFMEYRHPMKGIAKTTQESLGM